MSGLTATECGRSGGGGGAGFLAGTGLRWDFGLLSLERKEEKTKKKKKENYGKQFLLLHQN